MFNEKNTYLLHVTQCLQTLSTHHGQTLGSSAKQNLPENRVCK